MNILGLSGSPHPAGQTSQAVQRVLHDLQEEGHTVRHLDLSGLDIRPCRGCRACVQGRACPIADDMPQVREALCAAQAILIGSPVHFGMVSGALKVVMDRTLPLRAQGFALAGKVGAALASGASRNGGQELVLQQIHAFMLIHGMLVLGDGPSTAHFGGALVGATETDEVGQRTLDSLANHLCATLRRMEAKAPSLPSAR
jgi:multimeric flavodoxin WrbA